jgi:hypothetical protein
MCGDYDEALYPESPVRVLFCERQTSGKRALVGLNGDAPRGVRIETAAHPGKVRL